LKKNKKKLAKYIKTVYTNRRFITLPLLWQAGAMLFGAFSHEGNVLEIEK